MRSTVQYRLTLRALAMKGLLNEGSVCCVRKCFLAKKYDSSELELALEASNEPGGLAIVAALSSGVGNSSFFDSLVRGLIDLGRHEREKTSRREKDDDESSERQNRLMQQAIFPFASQLQKFERGETSSVHVIDHGTERAYIVTDDQLNKQTIFVHSQQELGEADAIEIAESEDVRKCTFHAGILASAVRLLDSLRSETPLHSSRATVLFGHGIGGGVAVALGSLLHSAAFDVRNVITLGSPRVVGEMQARTVSGLNAVRVVIAGDGFSDLPLITSEGNPLVHVGEMLVLEPTSQTTMQPFSLDHYVELLSDPGTPLSYMEGDHEDEESHTNQSTNTRVRHDEFFSPE